MLQGKAILQELCVLNLDWDKPVPEEAKMKWERWRMELMKLQSMADFKSLAFQNLEFKILSDFKILAFQNP